MMTVYKQGDPVVVSGHAVRRFKERCGDRRSADQVRAHILKTLAAGEIVKSSFGTPPADPQAWYVSLNDPSNRLGGGWTAKIVAKSGVWEVVTITRRHGKKGNEFERRRRDRRAWKAWMQWCADNQVSPTPDAATLRRFAEDQDGVITNASRRMGVVLRKVWVQMNGGTYEDAFAALPPVTIRTATGKEVWL